jgi:hypothetical protein
MTVLAYNPLCQEPKVGRPEGSGRAGKKMFQNLSLPQACSDHTVVMFRRGVDIIENVTHDLLLYMTPLSVQQF